VRRFWKEAAVVGAGDSFGVQLDGKPLKTPARVPLAVPTAALAEAIAAEWNAAGDVADLRDMPLTGLANAAIDRAGVNPVGFAATIARYGESDLTCYRAEGPPALVERQAEAWDALLGWARRRYDVHFATCSGVIHIAQPAETVRKLGHAVAVLDPFRLAGLSPLVTIGGSLVAGLAVLEQAIPADAAWEAVSLDERWQLEQWGSDADGEAMLDARRRDFLVAARFLELLS
jgi:chaperone required for assembly of F1-ATPase